MGIQCFVRFIPLNYKWYVRRLFAYDCLFVSGRLAQAQMLGVGVESDVDR